MQYTTATNIQKLNKDRLPKPVQLERAENNANLVLQIRIIMKRFFRYIILATLLSAALSSCKSKADKVDVFYIVSTNVDKSLDADGNEVFNAVLTEDEKSWLTEEIIYIRDNLFGERFNFYGPLYHQVTMRGFKQSSEVLEEAYAKARQEIFEEFDKFVSSGHRFILAGYSQGGMILVDLLKHMSDEEYSRMVASYSIGYGLSAEDVAHPHVRPAEGPDDTGVCISFNSVSAPSGIVPRVYNNSATCINPVNWHTDATPATFDFDGQQLSVHVDTSAHVLYVDGLKSTKNDFDGFFPEGCLHQYEYIYAEHIKKNAILRAYGK